MIFVSSLYPGSVRIFVSFIDTNAMLAIEVGPFDVVLFGLLCPQKKIFYRFQQKKKKMHTDVLNA